MKATVFGIAILLPLLVAGQQVPDATPATQFQSAPSVAEVRMMLQSDDPISQAWGAWWTAQAQMRAMGAFLQRNLEAHYQGRTLVDEAVMDQTLDAYIQNSDSLPPIELLKSIYPRRPTQAIILLSRTKPSPEVDAALLQLLQTEEGLGTGVEWYAMADLLLAHRASGFAASLLRKVKITLRVTVTDPVEDNRVSVSIQGPSMGGEGSLGVTFAPGVPPWPLYTLLRVPENQIVLQRSSTFVVSRPVSIGYNRRVGPANNSPSEIQSSHGWRLVPGVPATADRLKYLAAMLPAAAVPRESEYLSIPWAGPDRFISETKRLREEIRQRYSNFVQTLRVKGLLTEQETANFQEPNIEISVEDRRAAKAPLPDLK